MFTVLYQGHFVIIIIQRFFFTSQFKLQNLILNDDVFIFSLGLGTLVNPGGYFDKTSNGGIKAAFFLMGKR